MQDINRSHTADEATDEFLYKNYLLLRTVPTLISKWARQLALEGIASCENSSRVIGISEEVLREITAAGERTTQQRGYWYPSETRYGKLFRENTKRDGFRHVFL